MTFMRCFQSYASNIFVQLLNLQYLPYINLRIYYFTLAVITNLDKLIYKDY